MIDTTNRIRQDSLDLEKSVLSYESSFRLNSSILSTIMVDTLYAYKYGRKGRKCMNLSSFWFCLVSDLIEKDFDSHDASENQVIYYNRERLSSDIQDTGERTVEPGLHLIPTKPKRTREIKISPPRRRQRCCKICSAKKTWECFFCPDDQHRQEIFGCGSNSDRTCFQSHTKYSHWPMTWFERRSCFWFFIKSPVKLS